MAKRIIFWQKVVLNKKFIYGNTKPRRPQWPCRLRRRSSAARLLPLRVRIPLKSWMFVSCVCCVLWQTDLSLRAVCVCVCVCVCVLACVCVCVCVWVMCLCVWSRSLNNEMIWAVVSQKKKNTDIYIICSNDPRMYIRKYAYLSNNTKDFISNFNSLFIVVFSLEQKHLWSQNLSNLGFL